MFPTLHSREKIILEIVITSSILLLSIIYYVFRKLKDFDYIILSLKKQITDYAPTKFRIQLKDPLIEKYSLCHAIIPNTSLMLRSTGLVIKIGSTESTIFVNPTNVYTVAQAITQSVQL